MKKLDEIWIAGNQRGPAVLRLDWSDDTHHAVNVPESSSPEELACWLRFVAEKIDNATGGGIADPKENP